MTLAMIYILLTRGATLLSLNTYLKYCYTQIQDINAESVFGIFTILPTHPHIYFQEQ